MMASQPIIVCHDCDIILDTCQIQPVYTSNCPRCGSKIPSANINSVEQVLALSLAALLLYIPAVFLPILDLSSFGLTATGTIYDSAVITFQQGYYLMALVIFITAIILPFILPLLLVITSIGIRTKTSPRIIAKLLHTFQVLKEWGMSDIYLLGMMIAIFKLSNIATIQYHNGFICFIGLTIFNILAITVLDKLTFWKHIGYQLGVKQELNIDKVLKDSAAITAKQAEIAQCSCCNFLVYQHKDKGIISCPRCKTNLHYRKPDSIVYTWAFLIVSIILIFPANLFPIMEVSSLTSGTIKSTIMDGIIYFFNHHDYAIGLIIFVASVLIPLYKIIGLLIILITVKFKWKIALKYKIKMFRIIEYIGRWSMLDIFVIAIMSVFVNFGALSTSMASSAAIYFCIVVIATMKATDAFDLRLLWDN